MNLFELTELSNEDFCKEIVQIDSEVLIDLLKTEEYTILKDKCLEMIKYCLGEQYTLVVKEAIDYCN